MRTLVWFRGTDLRVADHGPLDDAARRGEVLPLFIVDPDLLSPERARHTPHRMQFLLDSLVELERNLAARGSRLLVAAGKSVEVVPRLAHDWKVDRVAGQRWGVPFARERDRRVARALCVPFELFEGETLHAPGSLRTKQGRPFSTFGAFARAFHASWRPGTPLRARAQLPPVPADASAPALRLPSLRELGIVRNPAVLPGGEARAQERLRRFLAGPARRYDAARERLDIAGTSRLSVDLKFGTLSAHGVWRAAARALQQRFPRALRSFLRELLWREFAHAVLWDSPEVLEQPFRREWRGFPWQGSEAEWEAWVRGTTGYPVVDAAARQLLAEGFVPNRARMVAASFLTKHLLIDYRQGEAHYLRWLTDGDCALNNLNWQWCAGSGADAQPYFRIFNPVLQGQKFDPEGSYVRRWLPELARVPAQHIHAPWLAPEPVLKAAGVRLGRDYAAPIVDHAFARRRFLTLAQAHFS